MTKTCDSLRNLIKLTDEEIEARFDDLGFGLTIANLTFTELTIDDIKAARKKWNEPGRIEDEEADYIMIDRAQPTAFQPRRSVVMIDFGAVRAIYGTLK